MVGLSEFGAFAGALVVPVLLLLAAVQCSPDHVSGTSAVASVTVSPDSATLRAVGDTVRFVATARTAAGDSVPGVEFAWLSSDTSVARVSAAGLVTAVRAGRAAIAARAPNGVSGSAGVAVMLVPNNGVAVTPEGLAIAGVGSSATLRALCASPTGACVGAVAWASLNPAVATVSGAGVVTAVGPGQATVSATTGGVTGYALATVAVADTTVMQIFAPMVSGTTAQLNGIWGTSATNVFAVGDVGTILHYDGSSWAPMASGTTSSLSAVGGTSATDLDRAWDDWLLKERNRVRLPGQPSAHAFEHHGIAFRSDISDESPDPAGRQGIARQEGAQGEYHMLGEQGLAVGKTKIPLKLELPGFACRLIGRVGKNV
jgi:uncharacterized protein YjdB